MLQIRLEVTFPLENIKKKKEKGFRENGSRSSHMQRKMKSKAQRLVTLVRRWVEWGAKGPGCVNRLRRRQMVAKSQLVDQKVRSQV